MKSKTEIQQLIDDLLDDSLAPGKKLDAGVSFDSTKTVAAGARKRISQLQIEAVPILKEMLLSSNNRKRKGEVYTLLIQLSEKYNDLALIHLLIEDLQHEKVKSFISLKLGEISRTKHSLTKHSNIILDFTKNKNAHVRHTAIQVLARYCTNLKEIEEFLISVLEQSNDEYDIYYTNIALQKLGTQRAIEPIKQVIRDHKKTDVLITGLYALGLIGGGNQIEFLLEMMQIKKDSFVKAELTKLISKHSDIRAVDTLIDRVKQILSRKRNIKMYYGRDQYPELVHALRFLTKFEIDDPRIRKLKTWIFEKKMSYLDEAETKWVHENM